MKVFSWFFCVGFGGLLYYTASPPEEPDAVLIFTGEIRGYLSPCGCAKPQIGGVKRMAGFVKAQTRNPNAVYVDLGNWTKAEGRQDELKAETLAGVFAELKPAYLNVAEKDIKLGSAYLRALNEIAGGMLDSASFQLDDSIKHLPFKDVKHFRIQGMLSERQAEFLGNKGRGVDVALQLAKTDAKPLVVLFNGPRLEAEQLAKDYPWISLIIFPQQGDPDKTIRKVGKVSVVSLPDRMRYVGRIEWKNGEWRNLSFFELGPEYQDDKSAVVAYRTYLQRVKEESLIADIVRTEGDAKYVGSNACASCHGDAYMVWKKSRHAEAMPTLEETGNDFDPECVGCHVVGLTDVSGYRDMKTTPHLGAVGCESCHGPASNHLKDVYAPYGKAGEESCMKCHVPDHSPGFDFKTYWESIKH